jgi:hypothetical protein
MLIQDKAIARAFREYCRKKVVSGVCGKIIHLTALLRLFRSMPALARSGCREMGREWMWRFSA